MTPATEDEIRQATLLSGLTHPDEVPQALRLCGQCLGRRMAPVLPPHNKVMVATIASEADSLARGMIEGLGERLGSEWVALTVFWPTKYQYGPHFGGYSFPRGYTEPGEMGAVVVVDAGIESTLLLRILLEDLGERWESAPLFVATPFWRSMPHLSHSVRTRLKVVWSMEATKLSLPALPPTSYPHLISERRGQR